MSTTAMPDSPRIAGEVDFHCSCCGYNLRGLSGDPRRCPECFQLNPVDDAIPPAETIEHAANKVRHRPAWCILGLLMVSVPLLNGAEAPCCLIAAQIALLAWLHGASSFAESCQYQPRYRWLLLRYHVYAIVMLVAGIAVPVAGMWWLMILLGCWDHRYTPLDVVPLLAGCFLLAAIGKWVGEPLEGRATAGFGVIQYPFVLEQARELHRTDIRRRTQGGD